MSSYTLKAKERTTGKKSALTEIRKESIPAVVYGKEPLSISVNASEFEKIFETAGEHSLITLDLEGKEHKVLVKDFDLGKTERNITHIDFYEVSDDKEVTANVPINLSGTAIGVRSGGVLELATYNARVKCLPSKIPASLDYNVTPMKVGQVLYLKDFELPEGVRLADEPKTVICSVTGSAKAKSAAEEEAKKEAKAKK